MKNLYILLAFSSLFSFDISAQSRQWQWAKSAIEPNNANTNGFVRDVATDRQGNVLATGFFYSDSITFGSYTLHNAGTPGFTENIFTVKYDASGNVLWAIGAGGKRFDFPAAVRADQYGNVYVSGGFYSDSVFFSGHEIHQNRRG